MSSVVPMVTAAAVSPSIARILASVESMPRLDVLLFLRGLRGKGATPKTIASACRMSLLAAEHHLAKLCARGLLAVNIGTELHYSYRPVDLRALPVVDELDRLFATQREMLASWFTSWRRPHVLIAEDDADMREILRAFMEGRGYRATALPHGRDSLMCAETEPLSLSIVDLPPSLTPGLALTRALRQREDPIRTIVTTSFGDARLQAKIAGLGISAVLEKPFELDDLGRVLDVSTSATDRQTVVTSNR